MMSFAAEHELKGIHLSQKKIKTTKSAVELF